MNVRITLFLMIVMVYSIPSIVMAERQIIKEVIVLPSSQTQAQADDIYQGSPVVPTPSEQQHVIPQQHIMPIEAIAPTALSLEEQKPVISPIESAETPVEIAESPIESADSVISLAIGANEQSLPSLQDQQWDEIGEASWYGGRFQGRKTANGEIFDTNLLTAAHQTLPFDTIVRVYNPQNEKSVLVRINDRGPFIDDRIIDLSRAAATQIETMQIGVAEVYLQIVSLGEEPQEVTIQLGAFSEYENAIDLINDLKKDGFMPRIETVNDSLFRVVLANVHRDHADNTRQRLSESGYLNILVRTR